MKSEAMHTRLENIIEREFELKRRKIQLTGTASPLSISFFLSQCLSKNISNLPHVVVVSSQANATRFIELLKFFDPQRRCYFLPEFDVSPYSGVYPSPHVVAERLSFLRHASNAKPGDIFLTTGNSLSQKTLPFSVFAQKSSKLGPGDELPENLAEHLNELGYQPAPMVEDVGQYAIRGGIVDIFSPAETKPIRLELFGDQIETLRAFNVSDQRSQDVVKELALIPACETLFIDDEYEKLIERVRADFSSRKVDKSESDELVRSLVLKAPFPGIEFLLPYFYSNLSHPLDYFSTPLNVWFLDLPEVSQNNDQLISELKTDYRVSENNLIRPTPESLYVALEDLHYPDDSRFVYISNIDFVDNQTADSHIEYRSFPTTEFSNLALANPIGSESWLSAAGAKLSRWKEDHYRIFIGVKNQSHIDRLNLALDKMEFKPITAAADEFLWDTWLHEQDHNNKIIHLIPHYLAESIRLEEDRIVFLREDDFFGKKERSRSTASEDFQKQAKRMSFGDLKVGDLVVHVKHGVGQYDGLKIMPINGVDSEFIQVAYKDKDKLYLPVYRVGQLQKYSGASATTVLDKLGGTAWEKTKSKVKTHLRDLASELLELYAKRAELHRPAFQLNETEIVDFEKGFPYEETNDQLRAIRDISKDLSSTKPMDRLICGDVGFGKTEVAMRAAFFAVQARKQVAVLAPTTVLTFQHVETFKKRFHGWPVDIRVLNRFVSTADAKKTLQDLKDGKVDILIATHRLLSKDVVFKDLGLLIVDEEQKFGVAHKEKIKKMRTSVDALTLSATPIPRTLNMSLVGIRDLSLINTAPVDRLPTRTFICKFDQETIRKAIESEIHRGGQVYFIHNRIQSIYGIADEVRQAVPNARIKVAHGQMSEEELESTMLAFFHHEIDVLVCTAIVESGMDVPRANTMFIDRADMFGLSQLYQLRGRVGRSKQRAYCYLILPKDKKLDKDAQERLKVIQENTALGSGIKIAQYDLELRGSGNILGEDQSGHVNSVGYELYMDLLNEALANAKGEPIDNIELDPEINLRIPAMIPESYIGDIRIRLSYYKALADISDETELNQIEDELRDQFGEIPEATINLMGLMLIRRQCKDLGVRDISAGVKNISLIFTEKTRLKTETVIQLAMRENKKYSITPDNRLNIRMNNITWSAVFEELNYLLKLC